MKSNKRLIIITIMNFNMHHRPSQVIIPLYQSIVRHHHHHLLAVILCPHYRKDLDQALEILHFRATKMVSQGLEGSSVYEDRFVGSWGLRHRLRHRRFMRASSSIIRSSSASSSSSFVNLSSVIGLRQVVGDRR